MAFPTVETTAESATATAGTNHVITLPSGIAAGNLILILMDIGSTAATINAHADYSELLDENAGNGLKILYRYATGGESNPTLVTSASTRSATIAYRISGAALSGRLPEFAAATATGTSTTPDPPTVTPTGGAKDYLYIAFFGMAGEEADDDTWANTPPTDYLPSPPLQKSCGTAGTNLGGLIAAASRQVNASSANPGTFAVDVSAAWRAQTIAVHPIATVALAVATATFEAVALTPVPGQVTVALEPATASFAGVALSPVPGQVTVELVPATATFEAVALVATPAVNLEPATATFEAVALNPVPGQVAVELAPAAGTFAAVELDPEPGQVTVELTPAAATFSAVELDPEPGQVTVALVPATASFAGVPLDPAASGGATLVPATATFSAVPLDPVPQPVTVNLSPAGATFAGVALDPVPQPVTVALEPALSTLAGVALDPTPGQLQVSLEPATMTLTAIELDPEQPPTEPPIIPLVPDATYRRQPVIQARPRPAWGYRRR